MRDDGGFADQQRLAHLLSEFVTGILEAKPIPSGNLYLCNIHLHRNRPVPFDDALLDVARIKVTGSLAAYGLVCR